MPPDDEKDNGKNGNCQAAPGGAAGGRGSRQGIGIPILSVRQRCGQVDAIACSSLFGARQCRAEVLHESMHEREADAGHCGMDKEPILKFMSDNLVFEEAAP